MLRALFVYPSNILNEQKGYTNMRRPTKRHFLSEDKRFDFSNYPIHRHKFKISAITYYLNYIHPRNKYEYVLGIANWRPLCL